MAPTLAAELRSQIDESEAELGMLLNAHENVPIKCTDIFQPVAAYRSQLEPAYIRAMLHMKRDTGQKGRWWARSGQVQLGSSKERARPTAAAVPSRRR